MKQLKYILIVGALLAGCRGWDIPPLSGDDTMPNVGIGDLRSFYDGARLTITDDVVIAGRVVSSDAAGNFYNTLFIDDGTGAVELMAGMSDLHAVYREGQRVIVRARGLAVGWSNGAMQLGLPPEPGSGFATGYFYHPTVIGRYVLRDRSVEAVAMAATDIPSLDVSMCGRLVALDDLYLDPCETSATWAAVRPSPVTGYRKFFTRDGRDSITVVTSGYAWFADKPLPAGRTAVTGILLYGKGGSSKDHFLVKPRYEKDIVH